MSYHPDTTKGKWFSYEPAGYISTHGAYFSPSPNLDVKEEGSERAILVLTDAFGLSHKNSKILADDLAMRLDCDVWVPDFFQGRPLADVNTVTASCRPGMKMSICDSMRLILDNIPRIATLIHGRPKVVDARLIKFIHAIQEEKNYKKIGAVGYGYGGSTAVRLASTERIKSVVICHPGRFSTPQLKAIKVPSAWICAEDDTFLPRRLRLKAEAALSARRGTDKFIDFEFRDYPGTTHGFACRPDLANSNIKAAYEDAFEQTVEWFMKTLHV